MGMAKFNRRELIAILAGFTASLTVSGCLNSDDKTTADNASTSDRLGRLLPCFFQPLSQFNDTSVPDATWCVQMTIEKRCDRDFKPGTRSPVCLRQAKDATYMLVFSSFFGCRLYVTKPHKWISRRAMLCCLWESIFKISGFCPVQS